MTVKPEASINTTNAGPWLVDLAPDETALGRKTRGRLARFVSRLKINVNRHERYAVLLVIALSALAMLPIFFLGIPSNLDLSHHFRLALSLYNSLHAGHLYAGWLADSNGGYGDASFRFYPLGLSYLLAVARGVTGNWYAATLVALTLLFVTGGLGIYLWARELLPRSLAVCAAMFYAFAPYHLNELYQAFLLAEFAAAAVLPFAFAFVERICRRGRLRDVAGLGVAYAILVLTHAPLTVIGSLALLLYSLLRLEKGKRLHTLARLALGVGLGLAASACYWMTVLMEISWVRADNIRPDPSVDYRRNFLLSGFSPDVNIWWTNCLLLASTAMFAPALALLWRKHQGVNRPHVSRAIGLVLLASFLMMTPLTRPLWNAFHTLQEVQFPWRWLAVSMMAAPLLLAASIPFWIEQARGKKRSLFLLALGSVLMSLAFSLAHIVREAQYLPPTAFAARLATIPGSQSVKQWLPVWVNEPFAQMDSNVDAPGRASTITSWEPEQRAFRVAAGALTTARIKTFFYPHWTARTADGESLATRPAEDGALLISLPTREVSVKLEFQEPLRVRLATLLSIIGWTFIGTLFILTLRRKAHPQFEQSES